MKDRRKRASKGVAIFSSFIILAGFINFLFIIISFFQLRLELQLKDYIPSLFHSFPYFTINVTAFWLSTIISLIIMLCWIVAGAGMLALKEWARQLLLISMGVFFLNKAIDIVINIAIVKEISAQIPILHLSIGIVFIFSFSLSIVYFFTHPSIRKQFERKKTFS
jgi:hypothetical protein